MKLSNLKLATVGAMVIAVMSLNLVNPFSSQSYDDVKGAGTEVSLATTGVQSDLAQAFTPTSTLVSVTLVVSSMTTSTIATFFGGDTTVDTGLLDESSNVTVSDVLMDKLD